MTKAERTDRLLNCFYGLPGEFYMLKGVLCMGMNYCSGPMPASVYEIERKQQKRIEALFDTLRIAQRMDDLIRSEAA